MSTPLKQIHLAAGFLGGLDPFVDKVVPLLQERGVFRAEYEGTTLRENLGLGPRNAQAARVGWDFRERFDST